MASLPTQPLHTALELCHLHKCTHLTPKPKHPEHVSATTALPQSHRPQTSFTQNHPPAASAPEGEVMPPLTDLLSLHTLSSSYLFSPVQETAAAAAPAAAHTGGWASLAEKMQKGWTTQLPPSQSCPLPLAPQTQAGWLNSQALSSSPSLQPSATPQDLHNFQRPPNYRPTKPEVPGSNSNQYPTPFSLTVG